MFRFFSCLGAMGLLVLSANTQAYGLRTHLWIGQQIVNDLARDCQLDISGLNATVPQDVCLAIRRNPSAFLAGNLGPDAYPDLITGQVTTHPGIEGDWQTSDWVRQLFQSANTEAEVAFAAGYAVHAASDAWAHSYVNAYSGDIFQLTDERAVERRHFVLEKYIDARLPEGQPDAATMRVPASFLRDRLIYNDDAARLALRSGVALHIPAMHRVWRSVTRLESEMNGLERDAGDMLGQIVATYVDLQGRVLTGEAQLEVSRETLRLNEQRLAVEQAAHDLARRALDDAIDVVRRNRELILASEERARAARAAIREAERTANDATNAIADVRERIINVDRELARTPRFIQERVCRDEVVNRICRLPCPLLCDEICRDVLREVCRMVDRVNDVWERLSGELSDLRSRQNQLERQIQQSAIRIAAETANEAAALQAKLEAEALTAGIEAVQASNEAAFAVVKARYDIELAATQEARRRVEQLRTEIARLRSELLNAQNIREAIADMVDRSNILAGYFNNWRNGLERAGDAYILTGLDVSQRLVANDGGVMSAYMRWVACHGSAYTPVPYQVSEFGCAVDEYYTNLLTEIDRLVERLLPEPFATLFRRYRDLKSMIRAQLKSELEDAALTFARLIAPDGTTADLIELLARPENATPAKLNEVFAEVGDSGGKPLLVFPDMTSLVDHDLNLTDGRLDPRRFAPLAHALTLSRLSLLDQAEIRRVVWRLGGNPADMEMSAPGRRYSVVVDMLRSIDGNHQWQPFGLPYARSVGPATPADPQARHFGYGPGDSTSRGFSLFVNPRLRSTVFPRLFPGRISGSLASRPELQWPAYSFPECAANPFPVAFNDDGSPRASDDRCSRGDADRLPAQPRDGVRRFWRGVLDFLGLEPRAARRTRP